MGLAGHSWMNAGHSLEADYADDEAMDHANDCSAIPGWATKKMQDHDVEERKEPADQQVKQEAERLCAVTVGSNSRSENVRKIQASESHSLGDRLH